MKQTDKFQKLNDRQMNKVRQKMERATAILCDCLATIPQVPCLNTDDVSLLSTQIDELNAVRVKLEKSFTAKLRPHDWARK